MEVCINECGVVLDTRWEQINWLDDITYTPSTKQVDNVEGRLEGKQDSWLPGNGQGKLELAAGWHHLLHVQEVSMERMD